MKRQAGEKHSGLKKAEKFVDEDAWLKKQSRKTACVGNEKAGWGKAQRA